MIYTFLLSAAFAVMTTTAHDLPTCHCDECMDTKIGQMIVAGFKGCEPSEEICEAIERYHIGGVIYFDADVSNKMGERNVRNPKQLKELSAALQSYSTDGPLFIAIDQEGGRVNRLKSKYGFPASVSAAYQGRIGSADTTRKYALQTARTLADCGININFAPCVDVNINPQNAIIGRYERSFSADADSVTLHSRIWVDELRGRGLLTSLKHYPGHGSSHSDSHLGLVDITDYWQPAELIPYRNLIAEGYDQIVMMGHLIDRNVDTLPASLSARHIDFLRDSLGFEGVVSTDDMNMGAIVDNYSLDRALSLAINAGVDMIIMGNNARTYEPNLAARTHLIIKRLVAEGKISPDKIDTAYSRLMKLKSTIK